jgi:hypothetical protein
VVPRRPRAKAQSLSAKTETEKAGDREIGAHAKAQSLSAKTAKKKEEILIIRK